MTDPRWLTIARRYIGVAEVPGKASNPVIANFWRQYGSVWSVLGADDSRAPWCGTFVAEVMRQAGLPIVRHPYRARAWLDVPFWLDVAQLGCLVIFERKGGGHVGFCVGRDERGNLMILGGNQGDAVNIQPFAMSRVIGYRWPEFPPPPVARLPVLASNGAPLSTNEA